LDDAQWKRIREQIPEENFPHDRPGREPVPARKILDVVFWILNAGAQWHMLPKYHPNYKTVHRRFQQ
jgi:transposase